MADQLAVLHLVLNHVGLGADISTRDKRIELQKVVCLAQEAGLGLGYSYNWYVRGPYSPGLTSDYYQLSADTESIAQSAASLELNSAAKSVLAGVKELLTVPENVSLQRVFWLELLASIIFLRRRYRYNSEQARVKISSDKPSLAQYYDAAVSALSERGLLDKL